MLSAAGGVLPPPRPAHAALSPPLPSPRPPQVVAMLNGQQMGGKRRSAYYYDL